MILDTHFLDLELSINKISNKLNFYLTKLCGISTIEREYKV
jgi:hypothetical protein